MSNVAIFHFPPRETLSHDPLARIRVTSQGIAPLITMIARSVEFHKSTYQCQEPILADVSASVFGKSLMYARNKVSHPTLMEGIQRATDDAMRISTTTSSTAASGGGGGATSARALGGGGGSRANLSGGGSQAAMVTSERLRYRHEEEYMGGQYGRGGHVSTAGTGSNPAVAAPVSASLVMKPPPSLFGGNATARSGGVGVPDHHSVASGGAYPPLNASSCSSGGTTSTYDRYRASLSATPPQVTTSGGGGGRGGSSPTSSSSASSQANFTHPTTSRRATAAAGINNASSTNGGNERGGGGGGNPLYSNNYDNNNSFDSNAAAAVAAAASAANHAPRKHLGVFGRPFVVVVTVGRIETSTIASFFKSSIGSKRVPCELWRFYCLKTPHEVIQMENTLAGLSFPTTIGGGSNGSFLHTDPFSTSVASASSSSLFLNNSNRYGVTASQNEEAAAGGYAFGGNRNEGVGIAPASSGAAIGAGAYAVSAPHHLHASTAPPPCTVGGVQLHPEGPKTINLMSNDPRQCKECIRFISDVCYDVGGVTKPTVDSETMYSVTKEGVYFDVHVERET